MNKAIDKTTRRNYAHAYESTTTTNSNTNINSNIESSCSNQDQYRDTITIQPSAKVHVMYNANAPLRVYKNPFYGYDTSDMLLRYVTSQPECEWIMFTNGDNFYNSAWFNQIVRRILRDDTIDIVAWDFVTHHPREGKKQQVGVRVRVRV